MEKKVTLILLAVVALAFWAVTLLFFVGNPFATTEGTYHYGVSGITVQVPMNWLDKILDQAKHQNASGSSSYIGGYQLNTDSDQSGGGGQSCSDCLTSGNYVYIHIANISTTITGKNWEFVITRIANTAVGYLLGYLALSQLVPSQQTTTYHGNYSDQPSVFLASLYLLGLVIISFTLAIAAIVHYGKMIEEWVGASGRRIWRIGSRIRGFIARKRAERMIRKAFMVKPTEQSVSPN